MVFLLTLSTKESLRLLAEHSTFWDHHHSLGHPQHFGPPRSLGASLSFGAYSTGVGPMNVRHRGRRIRWTTGGGSCGLGSRLASRGPFQDPLLPPGHPLLSNGPILWGLLTPLWTPIHPLDQVFCPPRPFSALQCLLHPLPTPEHPSGACFQGPSSLQAESSVFW